MVNFFFDHPILSGARLIELFVESNSFASSMNFLRIPERKEMKGKGRKQKAEGGEIERKKEKRIFN